MKHTLRVKMIKLGFLMHSISTAYGSLLESAPQNSSAKTPTQAETPTQYEKYSIYTRQCIAEGRVEGRAEGIAEGIASLIKTKLLPYDKFMGSDQYSDDIKARVTQLLKPVSH